MPYSSGKPASPIRAVQISTGLGAGNIGDELMARAFWEHLPTRLSLEVPLFPESVRQHAPYPQPHRYIAVDYNGNESAIAGMPGLLAGATPVTEAEGLHWPMQFLAPRLRHFHELGLPVDAVGVGVDALCSVEAVGLFRECFGPIRSWTVRSSTCREALLSLGVPADRIRVGADWAWLYQRRDHMVPWARSRWVQLGIDPARPLLVANVVNMFWRDALETKQRIASALDRAAKQLGLQIAFLSNECREGEFFDVQAAREMAGRMSVPAVVVPNEYYSPDEALALMGEAAVAIAQRYHFMVEAVLAGAVPVGILRGQKMTALAAELNAPVGGRIEEVDEYRLYGAIREAVENRLALLSRLEQGRRSLAERAANNLSFLAELPPYRDAWRSESSHA